MQEGTHIAYQRSYGRTHDGYFSSGNSPSLRLIMFGYVVVSI